MPPVRPAKRKPSAAKAGTLAIDGFISKPEKDEAVANPPAELTDSAPTAPEPAKKKLPKTICKGVKDAQFYDSEKDWNEKYHQVIGTSTRKIFFGTNFELQDKHIDDVLATGSRICEKLTDFIFTYGDVSYGAHNGAWHLTNDAVICLAKACPNLKKIQLQATSHVTDDALFAFFEHCPNLTSVELTGGSGADDSLSGDLLDKLRQHPEWAPKLKTLALKQGDTRFMKAMRALTREREGLTVILVTRHEFKKWRDWKLEEIRQKYKKGRIQPGLC